MQKGVNYSNKICLEKLSFVIFFSFLAISSLISLKNNDQFLLHVSRLYVRHYVVNTFLYISLSDSLLSGCISLVKSKIGLLREITRILFCERNKKSEKGLIAD